MCLICVEYNKLSMNELVQNSLELVGADPEHAEEFFLKLEKENPELLDKMGEVFYDELRSFNYDS